jgi:hypothetical protein
MERNARRQQRLLAVEIDAPRPESRPDHQPRSELSF